jgi:hypothetical protein
VHRACLVIVDALWGNMETLFYWSRRGEEKMAPSALLRLGGDVCPLSPSDVGISGHAAMSMLASAPELEVGK